VGVGAEGVYAAQKRHGQVVALLHGIGVLKKVLHHVVACVERD
jgi:hypothetical protein